MTEIAQRSLMPAAADELFAWQARPGAFERLLPPWEQVELRRVARSLSGGEHGNRSSFAGRRGRSREASRRNSSSRSAPCGNAGWLSLTHWLM